MLQAAIRQTLFSALLVSVGMIFACGPAAPSELSLSGMTIAPPSQMVARRSSRTAFIVLDPAKVPSQLTVLVDGVDQGGRLTDARTFVTRDLQRALSAYFDRVEVVAPGQPTGTTPSVIVDVKLDRVDTIISQTLQTRHQDVASGSAVLTWGFGLRLAETPDYIFSFSDASASVPSDDPQVAFRSMFERAIGKMLNRYNEQHVQERLLQAQPATASQAS
jgi:hypothetical protein